MVTDTVYAVDLRSVTKLHHRGEGDVVALKDLSLTVPRGEFLSIMGPSGSGKSTILNLIAGLDVPTHGHVIVDGTSLADLNDDALTDLRRTRVGVIFQFFNLLPNITAMENVALPLRAGGVSRRDLRQRAADALALVGLSHRADHRPAELSGGEMQRVAIARALAIEPAIILADEPTGNLDSLAGEEIMQLIRGCNRQRAVTVVLVTHSAIAAAYGDRVVTLRDGAIANDIVNRPSKEPSRPRSVPCTIPPEDSSS